MAAAIKKLVLNELSLVNFKNYESAEISFSSGINCFTGKNGIGKTNLMDAIYYLSFSKSYFNPIDSQNVKHDQEFFVVQGKYLRGEEEERIYCGVKKGQKKQFKRNKKEYQKLAEHIGLIPLVMISPSDTQLILGGSEERRKYIDGIISQYNKEYLDNLLRYNKALASRNKLLKDFSHNGRFDDTSLEVFTDQLVAYGSKIHDTRKHFIEDLKPVFQEYYNRISGSAETVSLDYQSQMNSDNMSNLMAESLRKDRAVQYTTIGIHKDDLVLNLGDYSIRKTGSQGQQKTYLLALKFAQYDYISKSNGYLPILLLDDIFDKLDAERVEQIVKLVSEGKYGQIFITDTGVTRLNRVLEPIGKENKIFSISNNAGITLI